MLSVKSSAECARKPRAEDYPKNFALIRLAERTLERQKKEQEEQASRASKNAEDEIAELQAQIARAEEEKKAMASSQKVAAAAEPPAEEDDMCPEHGRKLEIICI